MKIHPVSLYTLFLLFLAVGVAVGANVSSKEVAWQGIFIIMAVAAVSSIVRLVLGAYAEGVKKGQKK